MTTPKKAPTTLSQSIKRVPFKLLVVAQFTLGIIFLISLFIFSDFLVNFFNLRFPGALLGIAFLLIFLILARGVPAFIQRASHPLLHHMALFFVPAIVGIVAYVDLLRQFPLALLLAIVGSTALSLLITVLLSNLLLKNIDSTATYQQSSTDSQNKRRGQHNGSK